MSDGTVRSSIKREPLQGNEDVLPTELPYSDVVVVTLFT